jgi:NTP pyrophosphatase (non-canonical NTP hydrolase)
MPSKPIGFDEIVKEVYLFCEKRNWLGLDSADLAKSIVLEAAELLEHYQWDNTHADRQSNSVDKDKKEIALEVADIFIYIINFCIENKIDLLETTLQKLKLNERKYPVEMRGNDPLSTSS